MVKGTDDQITNPPCIGAEDRKIDKGTAGTEDGWRSSVRKGDDLDVDAA